MPFNGSNVYSPPGADFPAVSGTLIGSAHFNNVINDIATALSDCVTRDGQGALTANMLAGGFKITNVGSGTVRTDAASLGQIQDSTVLWGGTVGGTADALTLTLTPAITAYVAGQRFIAKSGASANTGAAATLAINGLAAKTLKRNGAALAAADIAISQLYEFFYDGTDFQVAPFGGIGLANNWTGINTFVDGSFKIVGSGDATKKAKFEVDGITTATERTVTLPDADITLANWSTGDVKLTFKTVADATWVLMDDGTIGNATSGGTTRANADTVALFTLLWNNTANADCAVSTGRGANAAADYAANKTIALPKQLGRTIAGYGSGSGLTARALAKTVGEENHVLTAAELASHTHGQQARGNVGGALTAAGQTGGGGIVSLDPSTTAAGSDTAHNTMQPTTFMNVMIKL